MTTADDRARLVEIRRAMGTLVVTKGMTSDLLRMAEDGITAREELAALTEVLRIESESHRETLAAVERVRALCDEEWVLLDDIRRALDVPQTEEGT